MDTDDIIQIPKKEDETPVVLQSSPVEIGNIVPEQQPMEIVHQENEAIMDLVAMKDKIDASLKELSRLEVTLEQENSDIAKFDELLAPVVSEERRLSGVVKESEINERSAGDNEDKRKFEKERFEHMEELAGIERKKWEIEQELQKHQSRVGDVKKELYLAGVALKDSQALYQSLEIEKEKNEVAQQLNELLAKLADIEKELDAGKKEREGLTLSLDEVNTKEAVLERQEEETSQKIPLAENKEEEHSLEEQRFDLDKQRHEIEVSRWDTEDKILAVSKNIQHLEDQTKELKKKEESLRSQIEQLALDKLNLGKIPE